MLKASWIVALGSLALVSVAACSDDETTAGTSTGSGGNGGTAAGGGEGGDGGDGGDGGGGQCLAFGDVCEMTDTCCEAGGVPGECYAFGMGTRCSIPCPTDPADCPNDGEGCNMMTPAYCKPPP